MKTKTAAAIAGIIALAAMQADAGIAGSKHDFSGQSWANGQICLPCHAPHNNANTTGSVLWNHANSSASYTFYDSPSMNAAKPTAMSDVSKTCMSCHDGTVAVDSFGGRTGSITISATNNMGIALGNDHPISITYNLQLHNDDPGIRDPASSSGLGGSITSDLLYAGKVECNSCHDTHNAYSIPGMLKKSNAGSALCLTCHNK